MIIFWYYIKENFFLSEISGDYGNSKVLAWNSPHRSSESRPQRYSHIYL